MSQKIKKPLVQQLGIATVEAEPAECISYKPEQLLLSKK